MNLNPNILWYFFMNVIFSNSKYLLHIIFQIGKYKHITTYYDKIVDYLNI